MEIIDTHPSIGLTYTVKRKYVYLLQTGFFYGTMGGAARRPWQRYRHIRITRGGNIPEIAGSLRNSHLWHEQPTAVSGVPVIVFRFSAIPHEITKR